VDDAAIGDYLRITGQVQGVGFRPFLYQLAQQLALTGWVRNVGGEVVLVIFGRAADRAACCRRLIDEAPALAQPQLQRCQPIRWQRAERLAGGRLAADRFTILPSRPRQRIGAIQLPPDRHCCDACRRELLDPRNRRYRYPFINCTQCGPRYTLITALPYDRASTTMADFPLCAVCQAEYQRPSDRRFHAEPLACPTCGPQLRYQPLHPIATPADRDIKSADVAAAAGPSAVALRATVIALRAGAIVAVRGVGGYHLLCDARNAAAIERLRQRKPRPDKPLAVMFPEQGDDRLALLRRDLIPTADEASQLCSPARPIVLCRRRRDATLAPNIAPGFDEVGALLPYSPLHHLLLDDFGSALVATSGNLGGAPVITEPDVATQQLASVADALLHHNRPIVRPADDALYRRIAGQLRPLRHGRGTTPLPLSLPMPLPYPILACGGHMKATLALAWHNRVVISPHLGDLDRVEGLQRFDQVARDLQQLYRVTARTLLCDCHPDYGSRRWAAAQGLPIQLVQHHHAHAAALYGESREGGDWLIFTWDGSGYGSDGRIWGGETLYGRPAAWQRLATLRPFRLPGGEQASRQPWRSALALCWESGSALPAHHHRWLSAADTALLQQAWRRALNAPISHAVGRLFDAAAVLLDLVTDTTFEGQGPMRLETVAATREAGERHRKTACQPLPLYYDAPATPDINASSVPPRLMIDWAPLLHDLCDATRSVADRAWCFHQRLALTIAAVATTLRTIGYPFETVGLSGGVFQNRLLTEQSVAALTQAGFRVRLPEQIPGNDAGIAFGQVITALAIATTSVHAHA